MYLSLAAMIINHHTTKPKEQPTIILILSTTYIASGEPYIDNKFPLVGQEKSLSQQKTK